MSQCSSQLSLEAFYDGQALPQVARELERHVATCVACTARLEALRQLSSALQTARPEPIRPDELARLHEAINEAADDVQDRGVLRLVAGLSAVAASILIISAAWLYDGPAPGGGTIVRRPVPEQTWERMAGGGAMPQPPGELPRGTAMRDTTNWMIHATGGAGEHDSR